MSFQPLAGICVGVSASRPRPGSAVASESGLPERTPNLGGRARDFAAGGRSGGRDGAPFGAGRTARRNLTAAITPAARKAVVGFETAATVWPLQRERNVTPRRLFHPNHRR